VLSSVFIVMALLGGSMIPVSNFPPVLQNFSRLTLNYWGIQAFLKSIGGTRFWEMGLHLGGMAAAGVVFSLIGSSFLKRNLQRGLYK
jgi:ABC-2 type transport system permease protein